MKKNLRIVSLLLTVLMVYGSTVALLPSKAVFADEADVDVVEPVAEEEVEVPPVDVDEFVEVIEEEIFDIDEDEIIVDPAEFLEDVSEEVSEDVDVDVVDPEEDPSAKVPEEEAEPKTQIENFIERCYQVTFGRSAGSGPNSGLAYWSGEINNGRATGVSTVYNFFNSTEYRNKRTSNAQYVKDLYRVFMDRSVDVSTGGAKYWVDQLNAGASRDSVFAGFANSLEFYNICKGYGICAGTFMEGKSVAQVAKVNLFVNRLYTLVYGRLGDKGGVAYWTEQLVNKKMDGAKVAYNFLFGPEYRKLNKSNIALVSDFYKVLMGRSVAVTNSTYWVTWLNESAYDIDVFNGFITSTEFTNICNSYGITRGNAFDKFSMDWENCFARSTNGSTPYTNCWAQDSSYTFAYEIGYTLYGFNGRYTYTIYRGNTVVSTGSGTTFYDSDYEDYVAFIYYYSSSAMLPDGTYRIVVLSSLGYKVGQASCTVHSSYDYIEDGDYVWLNYDHALWEEERLYLGYGGFWDGDCTSHNNGYTDSYSSVCNRMSFVVPVYSNVGTLRYQWFYSANGTWSNRQAVGLGGNMTMRVLDGDFYYYECFYNTSASNIPRGTYWCVVQDANGSAIFIARTRHA